MPPTSSTAAPGLSAEVFTSVERLAPQVGEWDELVVHRERPLSSPTWALGWWRHLRPADADLRVILVRDHEELIGVAPFYAVGRFYSMLGGDFGAAEILCLPGREEEVGAAIARTLAAGAKPSLVALRYRTTSPDWPALLDAGWPNARRAWGRDLDQVPISLIEMDDRGVEGWLGDRSRSFRRNVRRRRRKLEAEGGRFRVSTDDTLDRDVREFLRLHRLRHPRPGETLLAGEGVAAMLTEVGAAMLASRRFRLYCLEFDRRMVAADLVLTAGRRVLAWNGGFDDAYRSYSPSIQCLVQALHDAAEHGERTMSLGDGGQSYKDGMANGGEARRERLLVPRGRTFPLDLLRLRVSEMRHRLRPMPRIGH